MSVVVQVILTPRVTTTAMRRSKPTWMPGVRGAAGACFLQWRALAREAASAVRPGVRGAGTRFPCSRLWPQQPVTCRLLFDSANPGTSHKHGHESGASGSVMLLNNSRDVVIRSRGSRASKKKLNLNSMTGSSNRSTPAKLAASLRHEYG